MWFHAESISNPLDRSLGYTLGGTTSVGWGSPHAVTTFMEVTNFVLPQTRRNLKSIIFLNCNTRYIVYLITCTKCRVQYVGRTMRRLSDRFQKHLHSVEKNLSTNVAKHFNTYHGGEAALQVQAIYRIKVPKVGWEDAFRLFCRREVFWILHLQTRIPQGLNFEWDVSHFCKWVFTTLPSVT